MCNLSNSAINNFTLALPSDVSHSRPSTRDEKERADIPWAVYRGLMRSQMRIGSPTDSPHWSRPALSLQTQYTQSRLLSEIPHRETSLGGRCHCHSRRRKKPTKCFICWSACRFFWNSIHAALSIHLLLHFFQVCFTWKWKFWLGATEPDKSPSAKKRKKEDEDEGISWTAQGLRKNVQPYPHFGSWGCGETCRGNEHFLRLTYRWGMKDISRWFKGLPYTKKDCVFKHFFKNIHRH